MNPPVFLDDIIPEAPVAGTLKNPRCLLLYGGYKIGKSVLASWLSTHKRALWLDYEDGSEGIAGRKINVLRKIQELKAASYWGSVNMTRVDFLLNLWRDLAAEIQPRFDYIIHDKLDNLEEWAEKWATVYYKNTVIGRNFAGETVLELDKGGGYLYLREKFKTLWTAAVKATPTTIFLASLRDRQIDKTDNIVSSNDLDLTGRVRKIAVGFADTVGYLYRQSDGSNWVSFVTNETGTFAGSRIPRLEGQRFKLTWKNDKGEIEVDWDKIFVP